MQLTRNAFAIMRLRSRRRGARKFDNYEILGTTNILDLLAEQHLELR